MTDLRVDRRDSNLLTNSDKSGLQDHFPERPRLKIDTKVDHGFLDETNSPILSGKAKRSKKVNSRNVQDYVSESIEVPPIPIV